MRARRLLLTRASRFVPWLLGLVGTAILAASAADHHFGRGPHDTLSWLIIAAGAGLVASGVLIIALLQARMRQAEVEAGRRRIMLQTSMDGYLLMDFQGRLLDVNAAYCDMVGHSRDELLGMRVGELEAREQPEETARHIEAVRAAGGDRFETTHRRKDGRLVEVEISTSICRFSGDEFFVAFVRDITERKAAEDAIRSSERRYRTLIENLPQKVFLKDRESVYVSANQNYARDLGITPDELPGRVDYEFFPRDLADKYRADDQRVMDSGMTEELEEAYVSDGREAWVHTVKTPVRDESGDVVAVLGIFWDITERKQAERTLERQNRQLAALNTVAAAAGSTLDIDVLAERALEAALAATETPEGSIYLFSAEQNALVVRATRGPLSAHMPEGIRVLPLRGGEDTPVRAYLSRRPLTEDVPEALARVEPGSATWHGLKAMLNEHGIYHVLYVPLLAHGRALGVICLSQAEGRPFDEEDIRCLESAGATIGVAIDHALLYQANQRRAEELTRANEELKTLDQMKNDFISLVGHELRTPLAGILGYAEFLLEEDLSAEEAHEFAATIHRESERLTRMVNAVLDLNKMEAGRIEYRKVIEDLNDVVRAAATSMEAAAGRRCQRLRLALAGDGLTAEFDPDRIQQVLLNLLSNAIKFSPEHSEIEVGTRPDDGSVVAWVRDQGAGIAPDDISRIFEKFVQADHEGKRLEGTGLGLPICKGIVEGGHAGHLWAKSSGPGQGATFYFRIPRHAADASPDR